MFDADVKNAAQTAADQNNKKSKREVDYLHDIDAKLALLLKTCTNTSQSNARYEEDTTSSSYFSNKYKSRKSEHSQQSKSFTSNKIKNMPDVFLDELEKQLLSAVVSSNLKDKFQSSLGHIADMLNTNIQDIPEALSKAWAKQLADAIKSSSIGQKLSKFIDDLLNSQFDKAKSRFTKGAKSYANSHGINLEDLFNARTASNTANTATSSAAADSAAAGTTAGSATTGAAEAGVAAAGSATTGAAEAGVAAAGVAAAGSATAGAAAGSATAGAAEAGVAAAGSATAGAAAGSATTGAAAGSATAAGAAGAGVAAAAGPIGLVILVLMLIYELMKPFVSAIEDYFSEIKKIANRNIQSTIDNAKLAQERFRADIHSIVEAPYAILKQTANDIFEMWDKTLSTITLTQGYNKSDVQTLMSNFASRLRDEGLTDVVAGTDIMNNLSRILQSGLSGRVAEEFAYQASKLNAAIPTQDFFQYAGTYAAIAANELMYGATQTEALEYATGQLELFASNILYANRQLTGGFSSGLSNAADLFAAAQKIAQASKTGEAAYIGGTLTSIAGIVGAIAPDLSNSLVEAVINAATGGNEARTVALRSLAGVNASNTEFLQLLAEDPQKLFVQLFTGLGQMQDIYGDAFMERAEALSDVFGISMDALSRIDFNYLADSISKMQVTTVSLDENLNWLKSGEATTTAEQMHMRQINDYMINEGLSYVLDNEVARSIQEHMWDEQLAREMQEAEYAVNLKGAGLDLLAKLSNAGLGLLKILGGPLVRFGMSAYQVGKTVKEENMEKEAILNILETGKVGDRNDNLELYNLTTLNEALHLTHAGDESEIFNKYINMIHGDTAAWNMYDPLELSNTSNSPNLSRYYQWGILGKSAVDLLSALSQTPENLQQFENIDTISARAQQAVNTNLEQMLSREYMEQYAESGIDAWKASAAQFNANSDTILKTFQDLGYESQNIEDVFTSVQSEHMGKVREQQRIEQLNLIKHIDANLDLYVRQWTGYFLGSSFAAVYEYTAKDIANIEQAEHAQAQDTINNLSDAINSQGPNTTVPIEQTNTLLSQILTLIQMLSRQNGGGISLPDYYSELALGVVRTIPG